MSVEASTWAWEQQTGSAVDKLILLALANFADDAGQCFPSRKTLSERAMCSLDTVDRAIVRLISAGLVEKEQRQSARGGPASNVYTLTMPKQAKPQAAASRKMRSGGVVQDAATLAAPDAATLAAQAAATKEPSTEPSLNNTPNPQGGEWLPQGWTIANGRLTIAGPERLELLKDFGGDETILDLAIKAAFEQHNPQGRLPLTATVRRFLSTRALAARQQDARYAKAAKDNGKGRKPQFGEDGHEHRVSPETKRYVRPAGYDMGVN